MRQRKLSKLLIQASILGALTFCPNYGLLDHRAAAQEEVFKKKEIKIKPGSNEVQTKAKEKNAARAGKTEKSDLTALDVYYNDYLIPLLTHGAAEAINPARKEILEDIETIEKNKELSAKFNQKFIAQMRELALKGTDGKVYSPQTRLNAAVLLGRLNESVTNNGVGKPEVRVQGVLKDLLEQKENDGLTSVALSTLLRHLKANVVSEDAKTKFVQIIQQHLTAPAPLTRTPDTQNYLTEQVIECLTEIAKPDAEKKIDPEKGAAKLAATALSPALVKIIDAQESEWLVESALLSLGSIKTVGLTPEDAATLEKAIAKFTRKSMKDWRKRITNSGASVGSFGGSMGGESGGPPGGGGYSGGPPGGGYSGGPPGGGYGGGGGGKNSRGGGGGGGKGGKGEGGGGEGMGGMPGAGGNQKKKNPFEEQPVEVRNARRIAHQRFERIHFALNGAFNDGTGGVRKAASATQPTTPPATNTEEKALLALISTDPKEKVHVVSLISKIEQFQRDLNSEKIFDLNSLSMTVRKSRGEIQVACDTITGDKPEEVVEDTEDIDLGGQ